MVFVSIVVFTRILFGMIETYFNANCRFISKWKVDKIVVLVRYLANFRRLNLVGRREESVL